MTMEFSSQSKKNDLGLGYQLGRRDVTCKPVLKKLRNIGLKQVKYF